MLVLQDQYDSTSACRKNVLERMSAFTLPLRMGTAVVGFVQPMHDYVTIKGRREEGGAEPVKMPWQPFVGSSTAWSCVRWS